MAEDKSMRMSLVAKLINVGLPTIVQHLSAKGYKTDANPNTKLNFEQLSVLAKDFNRPDLLSDAPKKEENTVEKLKVDDDLPLYFRDNANVIPPKTTTPELVVPEPKEEIIPSEPEKIKLETKLEGPKVIGKIDLDALNNPPPAPKVEPVEAPAVVVPVVEEKIEKVVEEKPVVVELPKPVVEVEQPPVVIIEPPKVIEEKKEEPPIVVAEPPTPVAVVVETPPPPSPPVEKEETPPPPVKVEEKKPEFKKEHNKPFPPKPDPRDEKKPITKVVEDSPNVELIEAKAEQLRGLKVLGKIELPVERSKSSDSKDKKKKRKRIRLNEQVKDGPQNRENKPHGQGVGSNTNNPNNKGGNNTNNPNNKGGSNTNNPNNKGGNNTNTPNRQGQGGTPNQQGGVNQTNNTNSQGNKKDKKKERKDEISNKDVQSSIKATYARLSSNKTGFGADRRREKRKQRAEQAELRNLQEQEDAKVLKVTEFISASDLASLMDVSVNEVIGTCMSMGMFVSINQRLDAEAITVITDEFGFEVQFVSAEEEIEAALVEEADAPEDLVERAPIVTIMGHVDHGKTSLLDYIRRSKVAAGEAGGITQHIGAYNVMTDSGKPITFLDTPGHEAFTAMRARGAKVTDVVIIVIAADDSVMPQTREAINHAVNAGVPIVFAFSKIDKPGANSDKIREALANMNMLVEDWGGKYQVQEISSKSGLGIPDLLEKVLLEAELLELKANPNRRAVGTVIEASLDKGRGYVTTVLVQNGTLNVGDVMLAGEHYGRVKAMFDYRGNRLKKAGPSMPVLVLGLGGAPTAGDKLQVLDSDREAKEIANKREQILREQNMRTRKHITLEEIGRRKAIGTFKELNVIVKGDVDGSVEALSDSLLKLSTEEVQVNIIHKAVGQVSESDVLLASTADAIVVAFQVRPSVNAKRIAEQEQIEIRTYSIIYQAIEDVKKAMEGLLAPEFEEYVTGNIEVREVFKISKIGTVAGCYVTDGFVKRNNKIRIIRDFIVIHEGEIAALKRYKDDVSEVKYGYECGLSIKNFNDIEIGDIIESYEMREIKRSL
ncbi:MAG: translation initiation factor IF-2 [Spirosomataceae bacterium]